MVKITELDSNRLILRQWSPADLLPFSRLNADPEVMQYFPDTYSKLQSQNFIIKTESLIEKRGWGFWAVELKSDNSFIGFVGLHKPEVDLPFNPCVEIGWRLAKKYWGHGYATEAAQAALKFAFDVLKLDEVVSFTALKNDRSISVMQKLNMFNTKKNFEHPGIPDGHYLREHVLYKVTRDEWSKL